jgi:hypothetical protein
VKRKLVYLCHSTGAPEDGIKLITDYLDTFRLILERKKFLTENFLFGFQIVNMQLAMERRVTG